MSKKVKRIITVMAIITVLIAVALAVPLGIYVNKHNDLNTTVDGVYMKSYHDTVTALGNVETKLSKLNVITTPSLKQELLLDIWKETDIAVNNLSFLGEDDENLEKVTKFVNQLGDYCYYLGKKLKTEPLSIEENATVLNLYQIVKDLNLELTAIGEGMVDGEKISASTLTNMSAISTAVKNYSSIDYPELIYDGPFSDGLDDRQAKFLMDKGEINEEQAVNKITEIFGEVSNVEKIGEGHNIDSYIFNFNKSDKEYTVFISKLGGYVLSLNSYEEITEPKYTESQCTDKARSFLASLGYEGMESVWVYNNDSTVYINFAYKDENNVVYYPDLIKVKVSSQSGEVIGMEAENYIYNHAKRNIVFDNSGESSIKTPDYVTVESTRLCLIPTDWNKEIYCKEIKATYEGFTYYLYFDLKTAEEIRALVVIDNNGNLLI